MYLKKTEKQKKRATENETHYMDHLDETGQMYNLILQVWDGHRRNCSILFIHFSEAHMCSSQTKQDILLTNTSPLTQLKVIG